MSQLWLLLIQTDNTQQTDLSTSSIYQMQPQKAMAISDNESKCKGVFFDLDILVVFVIVVYFYFHFHSHVLRLRHGLFGYLVIYPFYFLVSQFLVLCFSVRFGSEKTTTRLFFFCACQNFLIC